VADLTIPRPHVPYGPHGVPEHIADADYLDEAARHIAGGYSVGGYNLTSTVIKLLHDTATALRNQGATSADAVHPVDMLLASKSSWEDVEAAEAAQERTDVQP
jgi:hypothetical protein